jgi:hypothetical protein
MMAEETNSGRWKVTLMTAILTALVGLLFVAMARGEEGPARLDRKVRVMERVLQEVLVQSTHVRTGMGDTTGIVLDDYGAVFFFHGELGGEIEHAPDMALLLRTIEETEENDRPEHGEAVPETAGKRGKSLAELKKEVEAKRAGELAALRGELVDTLIDYGPTLGELGDDRWVVVAGVLDGGFFSDFEGGREVRLVLKARIRDLRQVAAGALTRQAMAAKVVVTEQ